MPTYAKHISLAREKLKYLALAYKDKVSSVVGDNGTKVLEQLVEADLARSNIHFTKHIDRHNYMNRNYPDWVNYSSRRIWRAYSDLGYDGVNGKKAEIVVYNLKKLLKYFEERLNERFNAEEYFKETGQ